ncbi:hypothetical protein D3C86_1447160 [compost metagenome]
MCPVGKCAGQHNDSTDKTNGMYKHKCFQVFADALHYNHEQEYDDRNRNLTDRKNRSIALKAKSTPYFRSKIVPEVAVTGHEYITHHEYGQPCKEVAEKCLALLFAHRHPFRFQGDIFCGLMG